GGVQLIDQQQFPVVDLAELVLRVGQDEAGVGRDLYATFEHGEGGGDDTVPQFGAEMALLDDLGGRERNVVTAVAGFGGRGHDVRRERRVLAESDGKLVPVDPAGTGRVHPPHRRVGHAGDVSAHDDLDRQRVRGAGEERVRVGHRHVVVRHDV